MYYFIAIACFLMNHMKISSSLLSRSRAILKHGKIHFVSQVQPGSLSYGSSLLHKSIHSFSLKASESSSVPSASMSSTAAPNNPVDFFIVNDQDNLLQFGDYGMIASQQDSLQRKYIPVQTIDSTYVGQKIWIRGRLASIRAKGNACFLVVRSGAYYTLQTLHFKDKNQADLSKALIKYVGLLTLETIVDIYGEVKAAEVKGCSQNTVEISIEKIFSISKAPAVLPFSIEDASRSQKEIDDSSSTDRPFAGVTQDTRLNSRWLDLRVPANHAIMKVRSAIALLFREALLNEDFLEIHTPKLISGESEGGSEVFRLDYFGMPACLAQSPQLYKQMAISADLNRVFEIGPVFRAEKSFTRRHLCEFTGLDLEMAIDSHYRETLQVLHRLFRHIFEGLETRFAKELSVIREQYPSSPVTFTADPCILHWWEAIQLLKDAGHTEVQDMEDLSTAQELLLGDLVKAKYGTDFYMVDQYPSKIRPFYTMPNPLQPQYSNSYDLFLRGQEICSGAQRCHEPELLQQRIAEKGMDMKALQSYIESFQHAVSPHAGAGIGLDRVVFLYLGLDNVRKASMFPRDPNRCTP